MVVPRPSVSVGRQALSPVKPTNRCEGHRARISQGWVRQEAAMSSLVFVGIDVSQARLDIAVRPGVPFSIAHTESAFATLVEQFRALSPTLIVLEATGGMEIPL